MAGKQIKTCTPTLYQFQSREQASSMDKARVESERERRRDAADQAAADTTGVSLKLLKAQADATRIAQESTKLLLEVGSQVYKSKLLLFNY